MSEPWFKKYNDSFVKTLGQNDAGGYGVGTECIEGATVIVAGIHHLDQSENVGKRHIWLECLDERGDRIERVTFAYTWQGRRGLPLTVLADKPAWEPAANIPMDMGEIVTCWVLGMPGVDLTISDRAFGLSTSHPDEPPGNTLGHHSFLVVFQRVLVALPSPQPLPSTPGLGPGPDLDAAIIAIGGAIATLERALQALSR